MPTYTSAPPDVMAVLHTAVARYHRDLSKAGVTVTVLCAVAAIDDRTGEPKGPTLLHHGVPAAATIKVNSAKDRVEGKSDATIVIDFDRWPDLDGDERLALFDHELEHLVLVENDGEVVTDDAGRPKLKTRPDDWTLTGFASVVRRHGSSALEARALVDLRGSLLRQRLFVWDEEGVPA